MTEFNVLTIFPEMFKDFIGSSICAKAIARGDMSVNLYNFRDYTQDKHNRVDDYPFGGGAGMLIMPQPVFDCFDDVLKSCSKKRINIYMSPCGVGLSSSLAEQLAKYESVNILCGHYEGVDQRIIDTYIDIEVSIGDYVLTGGELPAMVLIDAVSRYVPGVLGNSESANDESFSDGLLEYPQYTRPSEFRGMKAPEILLSGHHANIKKWQKAKSIEKTMRLRPDLLKD